MQTRIEPPTLISRLLTFVFAAMVVAVGVLLYTLYKIYPLERPQIFFLVTQPADNLEVTVVDMPPQDENLEIYKRSFIREYIKARNEIVTNQKVMIKKWNNDDEGIVHAWSSPEVYGSFTETNMWNALMTNTPDFEFFCPVEFQPGAITPRTDDTYYVNFSYFCANSDGQTGKKDYTIIVKLAMDDQKDVKWSDRMKNPLGLRVVEYEVDSGNGDPLDTGYLN